MCFVVFFQRDTATHCKSACWFGKSSVATVLPSSMSGTTWINMEKHRVYVALWFLVQLLSFAHIHLGVMSDIRCLVTVGRDQWMECRRIAALHAHLVYVCKSEEMSDDGWLALDELEKRYKKGWRDIWTNAWWLIVNASIDVKSTTVLSWIAWRLRTQVSILVICSRYVSVTSTVYCVLYIFSLRYSSIAKPPFRQKQLGRLDVWLTENKYAHVPKSIFWIVNTFLRYTGYSIHDSQTNLGAGKEQLVSVRYR